MHEKTPHEGRPDYQPRGPLTTYRGHIFTGSYTHAIIIPCCSLRRRRTRESILEGQKKLGQLLVERGAITGEQLIRAIQSQRAVGGRIGTCLLEMDVLTEDHLLEALSQQLAVPAAHIDSLRGIDDDVLDLVPAKVALRCQAIPFAASETQIQVATLNVHNLALLDELAFCSNRRVRPHIANEVRIFEALEKYYGYECPARFGHLLDRLNRSRYLWDESAKILLGSSVEMEWQGLEVLESQWEEQRRLMRPAASRSQRSTPQRPSTAPEPSRRSMTTTEFEHLLTGKTDRDRIAQLLLSFWGQSFSRTLLFRITKGAARPWKAHGVELDPRWNELLEVSLGEPSIFHQLAQGAEGHLGPLPPLPAHRRLSKLWGGELCECLLLPLRIRGRLVAIAYGDRGARGLAGIDVDALRQTVQRAAVALELCILKKKMNQW